MFNKTSQNLWLKNKGIKNETKNKFSFREELYVFLNSTICHCYRHLAQVDRSNLERFVWFCIHIIDACALIFFTMSIWNDFTISPLVTTLHDTIYPIRNIPFPAVSICSNNRISRKEVESLAKELSKKEGATKDVEGYIKDLYFIGRVYDYEVENEHLMTIFQQTIDKNINGSDFMNIIERLTPKCEDILMKCIFKSRPFKCMLKYEMMETRKTSSGLCCSFNYVWNNDNNQKNYPYHNEITGSDMGLILVLNTFTEDYFYNIRNTMGFHIYIHNSFEYPDPMSGTAIERLVSSGEEIFIRVDGSSITSTREILGYSAEKRQCLFSDEIKSYQGKYTRSECLLNCKIRSARALCDCVPFQLPSLIKSSSQNIVCTLQHISCLNKYKIKWNTITSKIVSVEGLEREMEESLMCPGCYPSCSDFKYSVMTSRLPLIPSKRRGFGLTNDILNVTDNVVVRVYFGQSETWQFKQDLHYRHMCLDVAFYWFEIFSNIGGLCGVVGGFSLIGFIEIFYFILKQLILFIMRKLKIKLQTKSFIIYP